MLRQSNAAPKAATTKINKPLKDARASANGRLAAAVPEPVDRATVTRINIREGTRQQYGNYLARTTSKAGDRYSRRTIDSYLEAVDVLGRFLEREGFAGDYADVGADILNAFLADYRAGHSQGGTNTKLRRLRPFFNWLEDTFDIISPFRTNKVSYYAPGAPAASALGSDVIGDMLEVCKPVKGSPTEFDDVRDTAIIRLLRSGVRRAELVGIWVEDVDFANQIIQVGALKDARRRGAVIRLVDGEEHRAGRFVPLGDDAMVALQRWLRIRAQHRLVSGTDTESISAQRTRARFGGQRISPEAGPMWWGSRGRSALTGNGVLRMIKRRAEEAGYDPGTLNVHAFRHTRADELLSAGVAEGDVMGVMGWRDRSMLDRYASNLQNQRAIESVRRAGLA